MPPDFYNWKKRIATMIESTPALKAKIRPVTGCAESGSAFLCGPLPFAGPPEPCFLLQQVCLRHPENHSERIAQPFRRCVAGYIRCSRQWFHNPSSQATTTSELRREQIPNHTLGESGSLPCPSLLLTLVFN